MFFKSSIIAASFEKASIEGEGTPQEVADRREEVVKRFLEKYFPFPYRVVKGNIINNLNTDTAENDAFAFFLRSITSKSEEWSYEREWRIIRDAVACGDRWNAEKKGALLDMIRPSSITLGCAAEECFENNVREYCKENKIPLYKMQKDQRQYRLNKVAILDFDT